MRLSLPDASACGKRLRMCCRPPSSSSQRSFSSSEWNVKKNDVDNQKSVEQYPRAPRVGSSPNARAPEDLATGLNCEETTMSVRELRQTRSVFCFVLALGVALFVFAAHAFPQGTNATLSGIVTDPSGAVMPGADLTLTNAASGFEAKSTSNERGEYTFRNLVPGTYDLKVSKIGFSTYLQKDIVLTINQAGHVDAALKVGSQTETVSVSADTTLLNYDNATVQGGIDPETLKALPLTRISRCRRTWFRK
ncbi:MAG: hypothetical protein DMG63_08110 [Acidobacteria bacterium]|nr:MAG: hypothetical protein DMG63_08110 [Acidobacteriota bacterium]